MFWYILLGVVVCLLLFVGVLVYCIVGVKFASDLSLVILHRFPNELKKNAKQFRDQGIIPSISLSGGSLIYSGSIEMTYVGSEEWDSIVVAYLPSPVAARQLITRIGHVEREFKKSMINEMNKGNESEIKERTLPHEIEGFDGVVHATFAQAPILSFFYNFILKTIVNNWHKKQNERWRSINRKNESLEEQDIRVGSNPVNSPKATNLLPSLEQRHIFLSKFNNSEPIEFISFVEVCPGKMKEECVFAWKVAFMCLGYVGAVVKYQTLFHLQSSWSYFSLIKFPDGGDSFLTMEDMKDYHDAFSFREKSTTNLLQFIAISDEKYNRRESISFGSLDV